MNCGVFSALYPGAYWTNENRFGQEGAPAVIALTDRSAIASAITLWPRREGKGRQKHKNSHASLSAEKQQGRRPEKEPKKISVQ